jgi:hypothetical protein
MVGMQLASPDTNGDTDLTESPINPRANIELATRLITEASHAIALSDLNWMERAKNAAGENSRLQRRVADLEAILGDQFDAAKSPLVRCAEAAVILLFPDVDRIAYIRRRGWTSADGVSWREPGDAAGSHSVNGAIQNQLHRDIDAFKNLVNR